MEILELFGRRNIQPSNTWDLSRAEMLNCQINNYSVSWEFQEFQGLFTGREGYPGKRVTLASGLP